MRRQFAVRLRSTTFDQISGGIWRSGEKTPNSAALPTRTSSRPERLKRAAANSSILAKSRRSNGTRVAVPPPARIMSSTSSRPPTVRAANTTCAPALAYRTATAAPSPREAPVTNAILPSSGRGAGEGSVEIGMPSGEFGQQRQLHGHLTVAGIDRRDRIVTGEAGVAKARCRRVAARLAHRPVEPVDRQEGEAVHPDIGGHRRHIVAGRQQLGALGRGDAVIARVAGGRA